MIKNYKLLVYICIIIVIVLTTVFYWFPRSRHPEIYNIFLTQDNSGNDSVYNLEVHTNLTVGRLNIYVDNKLQTECLQYMEYGSTRVFTATIETIPAREKQLVEVEVVFPSNKTEKSKVSKYIPPDSEGFETGNSEQGDETSMDTTEKKQEKLTVTAACVPNQTSFANDIDAVFTAYTNFEAQKVTIDCVSLTSEYDTMSMHTVTGREWTFNADFVENSTFTMTFTAYSNDGQSAQTTLTVTYPFY